MITTAPGPQLLWLDLETSGLDPTEHVIFELAAMVTDPHLRVVSTYTTLVRQPLEAWGRCSDFVADMHETSGLRADHDAASVKPQLDDVEAELLRLIDAHWAPDDLAVLAGNSLASMELPWLRHHMPAVAARLHRRVMDVSTLMHLAMPYVGLPVPKVPKGIGCFHRALGDLRRSHAWLCNWARAVTEVYDRAVNGPPDTADDPTTLEEALWEMRERTPREQLEDEVRAAVDSGALRGMEVQRFVGCRRGLRDLPLDDLQVLVKKARALEVTPADLEGTP